MRRGLDDVMFSWSENPSKDMWNHLRFLKQTSNCKRLLSGGIASGRTLLYTQGPELDRKAEQLSMCIAQADEYFLASEQVTINTSPLLVLYGMLSLAKGLVVANQQAVFLESISYHGLHTRPADPALQQYRADPATWRMEQEFAVTNDGVFSHLTEILAGRAFPVGCVFKMKDVISVCPETAEMYERYYGEPARTRPLYDHEVSANPFSMRLSIAGLDENPMITSVPELRVDFDLDPQPLHGQARTFRSRANLNAPPEYLGIHDSFLGGYFVIGGLPYTAQDGVSGKRFVDPALSDYVALFILSQCVRYKQVFWGSILAGHHVGVLGLLQLYLATVKRRFPNTMLNNLFGEPFSYGSPGYSV